MNYQYTPELIATSCSFGSTSMLLTVYWTSYVLWDVQLVYFSSDYVVREDTRAHIALGQSYKWILLFIPKECGLFLILFLIGLGKVSICQIIGHVPCT